MNNVITEYHALLNVNNALRLRPVSVTLKVMAFEIQIESRVSSYTFNNFLYVFQFTGTRVAVVGVVNVI